MLSKELAPNVRWSSPATKGLVAGFTALGLLLWQFATPDIIPKPLEILGSLGDLWKDGFGVHLYVSMTLYIEALILSTVVSLIIAYASTMEIMRPLSNGIGQLRFAGLTGLPFLLTLYIGGAHNLKLSLLLFSISVFLVTGMIDVLNSIPKEKFDLARTLQMNEWQVLWEVQILGTVDIMFDVVKQNAAIGWMMLPMVEGLWKSEGGIGAVMDVQNRTLHLSTVFAIQVTILAMGLLQDKLIWVVKNISCPYAKLLLERR